MSPEMSARITVCPRRGGPATTRATRSRRGCAVTTSTAAADTSGDSVLAAAFNLTQAQRTLPAVRGVTVHAVVACLVHTDMSRDQDIPKTSPSPSRAPSSTAWITGSRTSSPTPCPRPWPAAGVAVQARHSSARTRRWSQSRHSMSNGTATSVLMRERKSHMTGGGRGLRCRGDRREFLSRTDLMNGWSEGASAGSTRRRAAAFSGERLRWQPRFPSSSPPHPGS